MPPLYFGGSFNPIHHGHLICSRAVAEAANFDRVVLVPTGQPPHKPVLTDLAPAEQRLEMCRLAVEGSLLFEVSELELGHTGPSYTIDTIQELSKASSAPVYWLIGADMLLYLPKWHRAAELVHQVQFIIMARPGWTLDWDVLPPEFRPLRKHVVPAPMIEISASTIRERVAQGKSIEYLTPPVVADYIHRNQLYRP